MSFPEYEPYGYETDYVKMKNGVVMAPWPVEDLMKSFATKGSLVQYLGKNGYDSQRKDVEELGVVKDQILTVKSCSIGDWSSYYKFEEIEGEHNTVMFRTV